MPRVPTYELTETLRPAYQENITTRSTPDTFGASIGRGMKSVAAGLGQFDDSVQRVEDLKATFEARTA